LADKPTSIEANNYLDYRYELSSPEQNPATFNVLWISDVELDLLYMPNSAMTCADDSCCHANTTAKSDDDKAPIYGTTKCYHSLWGFRKMIDTINHFNTSSWGSI